MHARQLAARYCNSMLHLSPLMLPPLAHELDYAVFGARAGTKDWTEKVWVYVPVERSLVGLDNEWELAEPACGSSRSFVLYAAGIDYWKASKLMSACHSLHIVAVVVVYVVHSRELWLDGQSFAGVRQYRNSLLPKRYQPQGLGRDKG